MCQCWAGETAGVCELPGFFHCNVSHYICFVSVQACGQAEAQFWKCSWWDLDIDWLGWERKPMQVCSFDFWGGGLWNESFTEIEMLKLPLCSLSLPSYCLHTSAYNFTYRHACARPLTEVCSSLPGPASCPVVVVPLGCNVHYGSHQCVEKSYVCSCGDTDSSDSLPLERDKRKLLCSFQDWEWWFTDSQDFRKVEPT